jgi:hypothetical protein
MSGKTSFSTFLPMRMSKWPEAAQQMMKADDNKQLAKAVVQDALLVLHSSASSTSTATECRKAPCSPPCDP